MPSGLSVTLFDIILETEPPVARFRFLAPDIGSAGFGFEEVVDDIEYLCDAVVVPSLAANAWTGELVVISLSSAEVAFGTPAPEVAQYFQPFEIADGACQWAEF